MNLEFDSDYPFRFLITGGAGFIGSNLARSLLSLFPKSEIFIIDNLSTGRVLNLPISARIKIIELDIKSDFRQWPVISDLDYLFHFAANADVKGGVLNREADLNENVIGTHNALEYARIVKVGHFVFASSAAVYGEPLVCPTPEVYPTVQTSVYGASKIAGEGYIQAYSEYGDFQSTIFRFVSWLGPQYSHGVVYDFVSKLLSDPSHLFILGDGSQQKSFLDVRDGISGILSLVNHKQRCAIFNLGNTDLISVREVADIVCLRMNLADVCYSYSGGSRGWIGDSPIVHLDISRALMHGWHPKITIKDSINATVDYLLSDQENLFRVS